MLGSSTATTPSFALHTPAERTRRVGGLTEFLLVGGLTPLLFPLAYLLRAGLGLDDAELGVGFTMFYAAYLINDPHFAVTYLLFYKGLRAHAQAGELPRAQRVRYLLVGFAVPLALLGWAALAIVQESALALGLLFQLMFLLVGHHYVKQGFGLMILLSARRGIRFERRERLALLAHGFAGWAYAWASPADPGREVEAKGLVYRTLAHPPGLEPLALSALLVSFVYLVWLLARRRAREGGRALTTPLTAYLCSIWAWSIYASLDPLVRYVIPALHSLQYLYVVWLLKGSEASEREAAPFFETARPARLARLAAAALGLGFLLFHALPTLLDEELRRGMRDSALGATPYFAALFAFVNIHHYFMDAVLWRRENPMMRYLQVGRTEGE